MNPSYRRRIRCLCLQRFFLPLADLKSARLSRDSFALTSGKSSYLVTQIPATGSQTLISKVPTALQSKPSEMQVFCLNESVSTGINFSNQAGIDIALQSVETDPSVEQLQHNKVTKDVQISTEISNTSESISINENHSSKHFFNEAVPDAAPSNRGAKLQPSASLNSTSLPEI